MIDYFNSIFTAVSTELRKQVPGIFVTGEIDDSNVKSFLVCRLKRTAIFRYTLILPDTASTLPCHCECVCTLTRPPGALQKPAPF